MTVYGEYLFIENFITGIIILWLVAKCCKIRPSKFHITIGGVFCGIYGFIIFINIPSFAITLSEVFFAPLITTIALGKASIRQLMRRSLLFFLITFLWGGITIALLYGLGNESIIVGTVTYMNIAVYIRLLFTLLMALAIVLLTMSIIKEQRLQSRIFDVCSLGLGQDEIKLKAMVDSGNMLKDPITGTSVSLLSKEAMEKAVREIRDVNSKVVIIPYSTIDKGKKILTGLKIDYITFRGKRYEPAIIATVPGTLKDAEILLNSQMLERGLDGDIR